MQSTSLFLFSEVCLCAIERTIGVWTSVKVLYHERDRENGPLFQALRDDALSVCSTETVRSMALVVQRSLFFTLEELRYEEPATEAGRALAWPFLWFENNFCQSKWSKKKGKQANASLRPIVGSKKAEKKSSWVALVQSGVHAYMSKIDQTQGRARRAIIGRRPQRDRGCEMTFKTEGRDRREPILTKRD